MHKLVKVYRNWYSWCITLFGFIVFAYLLFFTARGNFYWFQMTSSNTGVLDKLSVLTGSFPYLFTTAFESLNGFLTLLVSLLQGVLLNLILYTKVFAKADVVCKIGKRTTATSSIGAVIAFLGVGCTACQTAIILPLISIFATTLSSVAVGIIMDAILAIAIVLSAFSILSLLSIVKSDKLPAIKEENE